MLLDLMKDICGASEGMQLRALRQKARVIENQDRDFRNLLDSMEKKFEIMQGKLEKTHEILQGKVAPEAAGEREAQQRYIEEMSDILGLGGEQTLGTFPQLIEQLIEQRKADLCLRQKVLQESEQTRALIHAQLLEEKGKLTRDCLKRVDELLATGADVRRSYALHCCVAHKIPELYQALVDRGADVNGIDAAGTTPMMLAAMEMGHEHGPKGPRKNGPYDPAWDAEESVTALLGLGADLDAVNGDGRTALGFYYARVRRHNDLVASTFRNSIKMEIDELIQSMLMPTVGPSADDLVALQAAQGHDDADYEYEIMMVEEEQEQEQEQEQEEQEQEQEQEKEVVVVVMKAFESLPEGGEGTGLSIVDIARWCSQQTGQEIPKTVVMKVVDKMCLEGLTYSTIDEEHYAKI